MVDERIEEIMNDSIEDLAATVDALVDEANARGGKDNITVVLGRVGADDDGGAEAA